ncbi:TMhelix containing protein [Vibrio phage 1.016.O._10N.286.46.A11]|nr:TMhelix containing protein [Vibrio phage 1.016.O._10N.286.46.A11]
MVLGDDAVFEISQHWKKTEEWVKRYLATTFLIILSLTGGVSMINNDDHNFERVRTTNARKREDI